MTKDLWLKNYGSTNFGKRFPDVNDKMKLVFLKFFVEARQAKSLWIRFFLHEETNLLTFTNFQFQKNNENLLFLNFTFED